MKKTIGILIGFLVIGLSAFIISYVHAASALPLTQDIFLDSVSPDMAISMDFRDTSLKDILKALSIQSGMNFIASEAVRDRKVTLYLDSVSLEDALNKLFKANNLDYERDTGSNIIIVRDWGKPDLQTITKVFYLKHARVPSSSLQSEIDGIEEGGEGEDGGSSQESGEEGGIVTAIEKILSEHGSISEDARTNSLIVTDIPSRIPIIEELIERLDVATPQVMIEVEMLDVSKSTLDQMGIKFDTDPVLQMVLTAGTIGTNFPIKQLFGSYERGAKAATTAGSMNFGGAPYTVLLDFLRRQTDTKFLARPRILTLNNETAVIEIITDETVGEITKTTGEAAASATTTEAERVETGVSLRVTPQVNDDGCITLFVQPTVAEAVTSTFDEDYQDAEVRESKSTLRVKDGETIVIGGLIKTNYSETITKWPFFGDLPLIGRFFSHSNKTKDKDRELIVFITPHIVKEKNEVDVAKFKPSDAFSLPEREQDIAHRQQADAAIAQTLNLLENKEREQTGKGIFRP